MRTATAVIVLVTGASLLIAGCGGGDAPGEKGAPAAAAADGLTPEQLEKGIGPITSVTLASEVDDALAEEGETLFETRCSACHKLEARYIGPALADVTQRRAPEYVMNMMLNPTEMIQKHPTAKALLAEYMTPMADQNLTEAEARAILEYLRENAPETEGT